MHRLFIFFPLLGVALSGNSEWCSVSLSPEKALKDGACGGGGDLKCGGGESGEGVCE